MTSPIEVLLWQLVDRVQFPIYQLIKMYLFKIIEKFKALFIFCQFSSFKIVRKEDNMLGLGDNSI
jgi:hypothetical protein